MSIFLSYNKNESLVLSGKSDAKMNDDKLDEIKKAFK